VSPRFVDTHCHFDFPPFIDDVDSSLARAAGAGVTAIIVPATEAARFAGVLALAQAHPPLYAAMPISTSLRDCWRSGPKSWRPSAKSASIFTGTIRSSRARSRSLMPSWILRSATICR